MRHRVGARGNATSFPLPWQHLLSALRRADDERGAGASPDIPWVGAELADIVSVLLKTSEEDNPTSLAAFVHQAFVRRHVVIDLIENAKRRGHRAYRLVDMARARANADALPEHGVPPEIIRLLPHDNELDKAEVPKAATFAPGRQISRLSRRDSQRRSPMRLCSRTAVATTPTSTLSASPRCADSQTSWAGRDAKRRSRKRAWGSGPRVCAEHGAVLPGAYQHIIARQRQSGSRCSALRRMQRRRVETARKAAELHQRLWIGLR